jgi:hypothetical protein
MDEPSVRQSENIVGNDNAGRDIIKHRTSINYRWDANRVNPLAHLIDQFKNEHRGDTEVSRTIDKLEHFANPVANEQVVGLEEKLKVAGYASELDFARNTKELFAKQLVKFQFSETAQHIHAILLAEVYSRFHLFIRPLLQEQAAVVAVNHAIQHEIIDPIQAMLNDNVLEIYAAEINGMLYFLTGNCHIKWNKC